MLRKHWRVFYGLDSMNTLGPLILVLQISRLGNISYCYPNNKIKDDMENQQLAA